MANNNVTKNRDGYGYKYTDIAQIHEWLEQNNMTYYQYTERIEGDDYIITVPVKDGKELPPRRGCRIVDATLKGITNPAQEQGSAITYARRYSLLMAFGLATEDDDAQCLSKPKNAPKEEPKKPKTIALATIDEPMIKTIRKELDRTKVAEKDVCDRYHITRLEELSVTHYEGLMNNLKGLATI